MAASPARAVAVGCATQWLIAFLLSRDRIGLRFGFLPNGDTVTNPAPYPVTETTFLTVALIPAILFAVLAFLLVRIRGAEIWIVLWWWAALILGGALIAGTFAEYLGTTWLPHEPFLELYFHPIWLPLLGLVGMTLQIWLIRKTHQHSGENAASG